MNKPKLIICQGLPASGKTTWAKGEVERHRDWSRVNRDDLREMLHGGLRHGARAFSQGDEAIVRTLRDAAITLALKASRIVISDDTNLIPKTFQHLKDLGSKCGAEVEINDSFLKRSLSQCITADEQRQFPVGASVIRRMWQEHVRPRSLQAPGDTSHPQAVICDLDGTLAVLNGRDPYDASTCDQDGVNENVLRTLNGYKAAGVSVVFVSGRQVKDWVPTKTFLSRYGFGGSPLFMRATDDTRLDSIVKQEIYDNYIKDQYNVILVIDDRDQVVDMWRGLGLETWQVNYGNF